MCVEQRTWYLGTDERTRSPGSGGGGGGRRKGTEERGKSQSSSRHIFLFAGYRKPSSGEVNDEICFQLRMFRVGVFTIQLVEMGSVVCNLWRDGIRVLLLLVETRVR